MRNHIILFFNIYLLRRLIKQALKLIYVFDYSSGDSLGWWDDDTNEESMLHVLHAFHALKQ